MTSFWSFLFSVVTPLGNSSLLVFLAFVCGMFLYACGQKRPAFILTAATLTCIGVMSLLKIYFIGCHHLYPVLDLTSPSGHAAMSFTVYGLLAAIAVKRIDALENLSTSTRAILRLCIQASFITLASLIALSRLWFSYHSPAEVILGTIVGILIAAIASSFLRPLHLEKVRLRYLAALAFLSLLLLYGHHAPAETIIQKIAHLLQNRFDFCTVLSLTPRTPHG